MTEIVKCNNCKGTGFIPGAARQRFVKCPICKGKGKKTVQTNNGKK